MAVIRWRHWWPRRKWRVVVNVADADDIPNRLPRNGVALVGSAEAPKWLAFDCPCRAKHRIMVNLDHHRRPAWRVRMLTPLTVSPSFDYREDNRRCHFLLKGGHIQWVPDGSTS